MDFEKLSPESKRAAFAHMDAKRLGKGGRHKKLSATKKAAVEHQGRGKVSGTLGSGSVKGKLTPADHDKGSMGGKLPIAKARPSAPKPAAPAQPDTPEARAEKQITGVVDKLTENRGGRGEWASLVDIRKDLDASGMSRAEQDQHLKRMSREGKAHIIPEDNRKALIQEDHDAAIRIGGEDNHHVALTRDANDPNSAPLSESKSQPIRIRTMTGTPEEISKQPLSKLHQQGKPTENDQMILANRYLLMHGDAGVQKKITQLENRKRLSPGDRATLAALRALGM